ncbi:MAG TPA: hypothetical protein VNP96_03125 [Solirubrobacterales bacterium]|nr:hypothetical protein [Solirubrobacterales bacterium]
MDDSPQQAEDFADAFESALARAQIRIETACARETEWTAQVAAGIRAALAFAAAEPAAAQVLTNGALAMGRAGFARYDRMIDHFAKAFLPGRALRPEGDRLPATTEKMLAGGVAMLIAQRLDLGRHAELPTLASDAIQFVLTPYLGTAEAKRVAGSAD